MAGYVRLYRSLLGHHAFRNDAEAMAFAWMIAKASWRPATVRYKGRSIPLDRGELAVSQRDMAEALDRDKGWCERLLKRLAGRAMVKAVNKAGVAVISICNYDRFQPLSNDREADEEALGDVDKRQAQGTEQRRERRYKKENNMSPGEPDDAIDLNLFGEPPDGGDASDPTEHYTAAFEHWWTIYPNKTGKRKAAQEYELAFKRLGGAKAGTEKVHARLFASLQAQASVWKRKRVEGRFIPHAGTWLHQSRWDDQLVIDELAKSKAPVTEDYLAPTTPKPKRRENPDRLKPAGWSMDDDDEQER